MTEKRQTSVKALDAYLRTRLHTSLLAAVARCGLEPSCITSDIVTDDVVGRVARLHGLTPQGLADLAAPYA